MDGPVENDVIEYPADAPIAVFDGKVVPVGAAQITPAEIVEQLKSVMGLPYLGRDVDKIGMTLLEAALFAAMKKAAEGDTDALEKMLNRFMGKPLQQVANLNMTTTLKDFLDGIARTDTPAAGGVDPLGD